MALAFGRSSVTSRMPPSRRVVMTSDIVSFRHCFRASAPQPALHQQRVGDPGALPFGADDQRVDVEFLDRAGIRRSEGGNA